MGSAGGADGIWSNPSDITIPGIVQVVVTFSGGLGVLRYLNGVVQVVETKPWESGCSEDIWGNLCSGNHTWGGPAGEDTYCDSCGGDDTWSGQVVITTPVVRRRPKFFLTASIFWQTSMFYLCLQMAL